MSEVSSASSTFAGDAESYERLMGRWSRRLAGPFLDFVGVGEGETVLAVGCGTGSLALEVVARTGVAAVTGIDQSEAYIACARGRSEHGRIGFEVGDACALPYADGSFDTVLSLLVLNFVPDAPAAAAEMVRLADDWQQRYGYRPVLLETFVETPRFQGTCYKAANWIYLGDTQGRGKLDVHHTARLPKKSVWVHPLARDFRRILCG